MLPDPGTEVSGAAGACSLKLLVTGQLMPSMEVFLEISKSAARGSASWPS